MIKLKIEVLHEARRMIESEYQKYVCVAVNKASTNMLEKENTLENMQKLLAANNEIKATVMTLIDSNPTLDWYLIDTNPDMYNGWVKKGVVEHKMRNCRLRLIDDIIDIYEYDEKQRQINKMNTAKKNFHAALVDTFGPYMYPILTWINNFLKRIFK